MTERREIKQRPASVWKKVREAYLAGEPAASVARRFDVGYGNLRFRANSEGWTRKAHMAAEEAREAEEAALLGQPTTIPPEDWAMSPPQDPEPWADDPPQAEVMDRQAALMACLDHAARAMARGDGGRALSAIKAAQAFTEITQTLNLNNPDDPWAGEPDPEGRRPGELNALAEIRRMQEVEKAADVLAQRMLAEKVDGGGGFQRIYHWRAANLGPEVAARDYANAVASGRTDHAWNKEGQLKPLPEIEFGDDGKPRIWWRQAPGVEGEAEPDWD